MNQSEQMKNPYQQLVESNFDPGTVCLATLITKTGSVPQVPGSSALFSPHGLIAGTLGGGIMEVAAAKAAAKALNTGKSCFLEFELNEDISATDGAICGGKAGILIDASPIKHLNVFQQLNRSLKKRIPGVLMTFARSVAVDRVDIQLYWKSADDDRPLPELFHTIDKNLIAKSIHEDRVLFINEDNHQHHSNIISGFLLQPLFPLPGLIIAGAGHIGRALTHLASLIGFYITVVDDRPEAANIHDLHNADEIITGDFGYIMERTTITDDTYVVIVTHGHAGDSEALRACIGRQAAYIGMIGSRRKTELMRKKFLDEGWATQAQWDTIHTPIGLDIGSKTVQEIAVSIAAELIKERHRRLKERQCEKVWGLILAAGESKRMGTPKMLLSFAESTIIETVVDRVDKSRVSNIMMVVGAEKDAIIQRTKGRRVVICINPEYKQGMYTSVRHGFHAIPSDADAIVVFLGDQPMIRSSLIDDMIEAWKKSGKGIIIPVYENKRGHPVLIDAKYRKEVDNLDPEAGLRSLMVTFASDIHEMVTGHSSVIRDIDTALDYQREITRDQ